jgi:hypothetical protein
MEDHFIKLIYDPNYICEIKEEIIIYNKENNNVDALVTIIECAENDLSK